jgi:cell division protein FtsB
MEKKNKNYFFFMVVSLLIIFTSGFIIFSLFIDIKEASAQYLKEKEEIRELTVKNEKLRDENHQEVKEMITSVNRLFINPDRPVEEIIFLENKIKESNLSGQLEVGKKENSVSDPWPSLNFNLELKGSRNQIFSFLQKLKEKEWLFSIDKMSIKNLDQNEDEENISEADIILKAYFLK